MTDRVDMLVADILDGQAVEGSAQTIALPAPADPIGRAIVASVVTELISAELWRRAGAAGSGRNDPRRDPGGQSIPERRQEAEHGQSGGIGVGQDVG